MKKHKKIIYKTTAIILGIIVILYSALFIYISANKKSIIQQVTKEFEKKMNGKIAIADIELSFFRNFPKISVLLNNVIITDSMFKVHKHPFFQASHLYISLSIIKLIKKKAALNGLTIEKGGVYLYTDSSGYTNTYLFKQNKDSGNTPQTNKENSELKSIKLNDLSIIIDDRKKQKLHNFFINKLDINLNDDDDILVMNTKANIVIHGMGFNLPRGTFLNEKKFTGKFALRLNKQLQQLQFDSINIKLSGQPFNLYGRFDLGRDAPLFNLRLHTRNINYNQGKLLMPQRISKSLSIIDVGKPLDIDASINGPLNGGEPLIYVNWSARQTPLKTPFLDFDNASFKGYYTNELVKGLPRNDANSIINITNFSAEWHQMPLKAGNIKILNLQQPLLSCDLLSQFPLTKLNNPFESNSIQLLAGNGSVNISYSGPIEKNNNTNSFVNGVVSFKSGTLLYTPRNVKLNNVNGQVAFKNSDVFVKDLQCDVLNNKITMQGQAKNLLTFLNTDPGKAGIDWSIYTPSLKLDAFTFLLKPSKKISATQNQKKKRSSASSRIDEVLEKASLHVKLNAANLYYKKFEATNVNADISLLEDKYILNNVSMNHAGGNIVMNASLERQKANNLHAALNATMNNVDVSKVLKAFDNFGQDGIKGENLAGKLTAKIDASLGLDEDAKVMPSSVKSIVDFSLKNGALLNYTPVMNLENFIFENRNFANIRFAELKDSLLIANGDIKINRMEIQSTVLSFFVEGIYSLKGNSDISIQVPLNNLRKRNADYKPENIGTSKKTGRSIFIRGKSGADGNMAFKLDLFNKYKKEKKVK